MQLNHYNETMVVGVIGIRISQLVEDLLGKLPNQIEQSK